MKVGLRERHRRTWQDI